MTVHCSTYGGASARDAAAEMFAEELAQALIAQAQSMGVAIRVEVRETTILAVLHDGGSFCVTVAPSGSVP
jgi:hypothetical protein